MTKSAQPKTWVRAVNGVVALAVAVFLLGSYWPVVKTFDLHRADLGVKGEWISDHARRVTAVTPGGAADRAGLRPGDVLEFDPAREADWVLASYRNMPEGFGGTLPVRHADGTRAIVSLAPERVAYLPSLNDRMAIVARLTTMTFMTLIGVALVWVRPGLMTWSFLIGSLAANPYFVYVTYFLAFAAGNGFSPLSVVPTLGLAMIPAVIPFAANFPRDTWTGWAWWKRASWIAVALVWLTYQIAAGYVIPFEREQNAALPLALTFVVAVMAMLTAVALLMRNYHRSDGQGRARMKWALLGMCASYAGWIFFVVAFFAPLATSGSLSASQATPGHWLFAFTNATFAASFGYAALRERVIDVQFAVSRTLLYGAVTTLAVVFLAAVHWLLGRMIEHSGFAMGLEGLAAIGLGLVLHRTSHGINVLVDRVLFRKHHQAEERLRRVTAALTFASDERSIAESLVTEPVRNLDLTSAALFYRDSTEGSLKRVLARGWNDGHAAILEADSLLVRYLQAEHGPLRLDDSQLLPADVPEGAALPVLAIPIVNQHVLAAVVLYGAHLNHTLLDPDEVELLHALAKAAATSHQQVRIAILARENASLAVEKSALALENETQQKLLDRFESKLAALAHERGP